MEGYTSFYNDIKFLLGMHHGIPGGALRKMPVKDWYVAGYTIDMAVSAAVELWLDVL